MMFLALALLLASSPPAVEYDHQVDFSRYKTWTWAGGDGPSDPIPDHQIRKAVAGGLAARGLSRVDSDASLLVRYQAARTTRIDLLPLDSGPKSSPTGIRYIETGSLVIDLLDASSGKVVWRGHATGVLRYGPNEIRAQIDAAVAELLALFPPGQ